MLKKYLTIFLISMVPILELRGAIPYSVGFGLPRQYDTGSIYILVCKTCA